MRKILILPLSGIGDALMFTPALELLKETLPESQIDALVMFKGVENFYKNLPQIDKVHYYDFLNSGKLDAIKFLTGFRNKYDASINIYPSNRMEYNLVNFVIGASERYGINYELNKKWNFHFLNNREVPEDLHTHNVLHNVKLVEKLTNKKFDEIPPLNFPVSNEDKKYADNYLASLSIKDSDKIIGMHAGCSTLKNHINRRWDPEKFIELSKILLDDPDTRILLFGGPEEKELKEQIKSGVNSSNFINVETDTLSQTAALVEKTNLFVTNDSGIMHIAAAMKKKIIAIIGPTNQDFISPWKTEFKIASLNLECAPCFYYSPKPLSCSRTDKKFKCLKDLSVDQVYKLIK